jgi:hypothetical protein
VVGALLLVEGLLLGVKGLALAVVRHLLLQPGQHLGNGKL